MDKHIKLTWFDYKNAVYFGLEDNIGNFSDILDVIKFLDNQGIISGFNSEEFWIDFSDDLSWSELSDFKSDVETAFNNFGFLVEWV